MGDARSNMAASVKARLLNMARNEGKDLNVLLVRFALERLLYRLSVSAHRDRFILKGGMLVTAWIADDNRVTRDADFLGHGNSSPEQLVADFREIMAADCGDGLVFDLDALAATPIREEMDYGGIRLKTVAYLERTRISVTIDIGFGDAVADPTQQLDYPTLLDFPAANVRSYPPATVIAEKFQAMVALGVINGRMKDYFDLWAIPQAITVTGEDLDAAIQATFERRQTPVPTQRPPGLSAGMYEDEAKQRQWRAYAASLELEKITLEEVIGRVWDLVGPSCARIAAEGGGRP